MRKTLLWLMDVGIVSLVLAGFLVWAMLAAIHVSIAEVLSQIFK